MAAMAALNSLIVALVVLFLGSAAEAGKKTGKNESAVDTMSPVPPTFNEAIKRLRAMNPAYYAIYPVGLSVIKPTGGLARSPLHRWSVPINKRVRQCLFAYERRSGVGITGRAAVHVKVRRNGIAQYVKYLGAVQSVQQRLSSLHNDKPVPPQTLKTDAQFETCLEAAFKRIRYPKGGTATFAADLNTKGIDLKDKRNKFKLLNEDSLRITARYSVHVGAADALSALADCYRQPPVGSPLPSCSFRLALKFDKHGQVEDVSLKNVSCKQLDQSCMVKAARSWRWTTDGKHKRTHVIPLTLHFRRR